MPTVCCCNSVVNNFFYRHSRLRGIIWWFKCVRKFEPLEVMEPISCTKIKFQQFECHRFYTVSSRFVFICIPKCKDFVSLTLENCSKFEREFNTELQSLGPILSSSSQAEPYLTHLAQWILGVGNEQWIFHIGNEQWIFRDFYCLLGVATRLTICKYISSDTIELDSCMLCV